MQKYSHLIFGGLLVALAVAVIVWITRQDTNALHAALHDAPMSPDETGVEPLNGLSPNNAPVEVAQPFLTYNVPEPGNVPDISSNQDYLTGAQASTSAVATADDSLANLLAVNLPASDFVN